jgi:O-antigen ligase
MTAKPQQAIAPSQPWLLALALSLPVILLPNAHLFSLSFGVLAILGVFMLIGLLRHRNTYNGDDKALQVLPRCFLFIWFPMLISCIDASATEQALKVTGLYLSYGLAALAVAVLLRAQAAFKQVAILLSIIIGIWAFNGVAQVALGIDMLNKPLVDPEGYANSFFATSQEFGFYIGALAAIPLYTLYLMGANRLSHLLVTILLIVAVFLGRARSGWIMFAVALLPYFYLLYIKPAKRKIIPLIVIPIFFGGVVMAIVSFSQLVQQQVTHTQSAVSGDYEQFNNMTHNYPELWKDTIEIAEQHWVNGVGVDNFLPAFMPYLAPNAPVPTHIDVSHPHHVWLEVAVSAGVIGLLGLLLAYAAMWRLWCSATPAQQKLALPMLMPLLVLWWPVNASHAFYSAPLAALSLFFLAFSVAALTYRGDVK